jgi:hypothetical protein
MCVYNRVQVLGLDIDVLFVSMFMHVRENGCLLEPSHFAYTYIHVSTHIHISTSVVRTGVAWS